MNLSSCAQKAHADKEKMSQKPGSVHGYKNWDYVSFTFFILAF